MLSDSCTIFFIEVQNGEAPQSSVSLWRSIAAAGIRLDLIARGQQALNDLGDTAFVKEFST